MSPPGPGKAGTGPRGCALCSRRSDSRCRSHGPPPAQNSPPGPPPASAGPRRRCRRRWSPPPSGRCRSSWRFPDGRRHRPPPYRRSPQPLPPPPRRRRSRPGRPPHPWRRCWRRCPTQSYHHHRRSRTADPAAPAASAATQSLFSFQYPPFHAPLPNRGLCLFRRKGGPYVAGKQKIFPASFCARELLCQRLPFSFKGSTIKAAFRGVPRFSENNSEGKIYDISGSSGTSAGRYGPLLQGLSRVQRPGLQEHRPRPRRQGHRDRLHP